MKVEDGSTDFLDFPIEEMERIIEAMEQAGKAGDLKALQWCARRLQWLYEEAEISTGGADRRAVRLFNSAWDAQLKSDPVPESIAAIMNRKDEPKPITAADAGEALDTVKAFFEENLGGKNFRAILESLGALRAAVNAAEDE